MPIRFLMRQTKTKQTASEAVGDLILRVAVGLTMAFGHGLGKIPPADRFIEAVGNLGFPAPHFFAWCATGAEFLGGLFLAAGFLTRPAAASVAFTMAIAAFFQHAADPFQKKELALIYLAIALFYLLNGAGKFSIDALCQKNRKAR
ncbi:MAG: DoxX family protein [Bdellovibrionota bacterium]